MKRTGNERARHLATDDTNLYLLAAELIARLAEYRYGTTPEPPDPRPLLERLEAER